MASAFALTLAYLGETVAVRWMPAAPSRPISPANRRQQPDRAAWVSGGRRRHASGLASNFLFLRDVEISSAALLVYFTIHRVAADALKGDNAIAFSQR